jgi:hypothetical protein
MPEMYHPVTGATATVDDEGRDWYEDNGWLDATPFEFQDNSWKAVNPDAAAAQEQADQQAQVSNTTAADPDAEGLIADGGPS